MNDHADKQRKGKNISVLWFQSIKNQMFEAGTMHGICSAWSWTQLNFCPQLTAALCLLAYSGWWFIAQTTTTQFFWHFCSSCSFGLARVHSEKHCFFCIVAASASTSLWKALQLITFLIFSVYITGSPAVCQCEAPSQRLQSSFTLKVRSSTHTFYLC